MFLFITHYSPPQLTHKSPQDEISQAISNYFLLYAEFFTVAAKLKVTYHIAIK